MKYFAIIVVFFVPTIAFGANFCASGWGTASTNQTYVDTGTYNGKPYYIGQTDARYVYYPTNGNGWYLSGNAMDDGGDVLYYSPTTGGETPLTTPPTGSWATNVGIAPIGTLTTGDCVTSGGTASSTPTATSTTAILGSIAFQNSVIITLFFLMVVGFMYNNMTEKKPWLT